MEVIDLGSTSDSEPVVIVQTGRKRVVESQQAVAIPSSPAKHPPSPLKRRRSVMESENIDSEGSIVILSDPKSSPRVVRKASEFSSIEWSSDDIVVGELIEMSPKSSHRTPKTPHRTPKTPHRTPKTPQRTPIAGPSPLRLYHVSSPSRQPLAETNGQYTADRLRRLLYEAKRDNPKILNKVNVVSRSKADLTAQMIVSFSQTVMDELKEINPNFTQFLAPLNFTTHDDEHPVVAFQRKVESIYYEQKGTFVPVTPHTEREGVTAVYATAEQLVEQLEDGTFGRVVRELRTKYPAHRLVVFLNGFDQYMQKLRKRFDKAYADKVRNEMEAHSQTNSSKSKSKSKSKSSNLPKISPDQIEEALVHLEVQLDVHFNPINGLRDLVEWLKSLAHTVSSKYIDSLRRNVDFSNIGKVKSGKDAESTFLEMLQQFKYMTPQGASKFVRDTDVHTLPQLAERLAALDEGERLTTTSGKAALRKDVEAMMKRVLLSKNEADLM